MSFLNIIYYFTCCTFSRKRSIMLSVSIARQRQDIVENVEGWHSTCHNVFFLQIFCFDALKSFLCLLNG
ncbi:hypothetical protein PVAP13_1KG107000 [Panicum virgatum]|uniref:Uncharacterized protein n=1 Tax=Panicum virgatum TaxID=38727 RepID=A0A8T0X5G8_PANVG|nr:hypothetical protein PVAP13_1KG107000 [Panicum virgatum]